MDQEKFAKCHSLPTVLALLSFDTPTGPSGTVPPQVLFDMRSGHWHRQSLPVFEPVAPGSVPQCRSSRSCTGPVKDREPCSIHSSFPASRRSVGTHFAHLEPQCANRARFPGGGFSLVPRQRWHGALPPV